MTNCFDFTCKNGQLVKISIDEFAYTATVSDHQGEEIGRLEFSEDDDNTLKLTWAFLEKKNKNYLRQGIGRECLKRLMELCGKTIVASDHDGNRQDDGSHLTGDAPAFVAKMREEGLILYLSPPDPDDEFSK